VFSLYEKEDWLVLTPQSNLMWKKLLIRRSVLTQFRSSLAPVPSPSSLFVISSSCSVLEGKYSIGETRRMMSATTTKKHLVAIVDFLKEGSVEQEVLAGVADVEVWDASTAIDIPGLKFGYLKQYKALKIFIKIKSLKEFQPL